MKYFDDLNDGAAIQVAMELTPLVFDHILEIDSDHTKNVATDEYIALTAYHALDYNYYDYAKNGFDEKTMKVWDKFVKSVIKFYTLKRIEMHRQFEMEEGTN